MSTLGRVEGMAQIPPRAKGDGGFMTLADALVGRWLIVLGFEAHPDLSARLSPLGLMPGCSARVLRRGPLGGAILVEAGGRSIAVGRSVARQIVVREARPEDPIPAASAEGPKAGFAR